METVAILLAAVLLLPEYSRAECNEFKVVEYEDRVEVVCVGEPLTDAQKKANQEDDRRQDLEIQRQRAEELKRQSDAAAAGKAQAAAEAEAERKRRNTTPAAPQPPANRNKTTNPQIQFK